MQETGNHTQRMARGHNRRCAMQAAKIVRRHSGDNDLKTCLIDLLSDLQHFCVQNDIDFADALRIAADHFRCERYDEVHGEDQKR